MYKLQKYRNISYSLFALSLILLCVSALRGGIDGIIGIIEYYNQETTNATFVAFDVLSAIITLVFFSMSLIWGFLSFFLRQLLKEIWKL